MFITNCWQTVGGSGLDAMELARMTRLRIVICEAGSSSGTLIPKLSLGRACVRIWSIDCRQTDVVCSLKGDESKHTERTRRSRWSREPAGGASRCKQKSIACSFRCAASVFRPWEWALAQAFSNRSWLFRELGCYKYDLGELPFSK